MVAQTQTQSLPDIDSETMLPDLLAAHPQARTALDRYGLKGCGGRLGPVESIGFFARTHGVNEPQLLREIRQAILTPIPTDSSTPPSIADTLYRRYFLGGIILILTAGATWGAALLWQIGFTGTFTGISLHDVNAHGHAQIFGWVGLFIMGFAYQAFPRLWHTELVKPRLAVVAFISMAVGLIIRTMGMTSTGLWSLALPAAMLGGAFEIVAILLFTGQILATFFRGHGKLEPYVGFVLMALVWFVAMSFLSVWHTYNTMRATTWGQLLWYVATYQAPLRDLQIHGLALFMILGVSIRMLPPLFGVPQVSPHRAWWALSILTASVIGEITIFLAYRFTDNHAITALLMIPWIMLAIGVAMIALPWKLWRPFEQTDRSGKFVRAAYAWLAISLAMLLLLPLHHALTGIPFSHAYYGAIRHAITVGFISLMIMGFAAKVVPTLNGLDTRTLTPLWGPFLLVNVGCFLRVSTQTLTDWYPGAFAIIGLSGTLEVIGLAWWGFGLVRIMRQGKREELSPTIVTPSAPKPLTISPDHRVTDILHWFPATQAVFDHYGFTQLRNPLLRRTLARNITVRQAASFKQVPPDHLLRDLNNAIQAPVLVQLTIPPGNDASLR
ncbi:MAG: DUF1858 domain-containing protein [Bacillota bacterium]